MYAINSGIWAKKSGQTYVQKFKQLEASARYYDNKEPDSNSTKDVVTFQNQEAKTTVTLGPQETDISVKSNSKEYPDAEFGGSNYSTNYQRTVRLKKLSEETLYVEETSLAQDIKDYNYDGSPVTDPVQGSGSDSRSFLVDIASGEFLTTSPDNFNFS